MEKNNNKSENSKTNKNIKKIKDPDKSYSFEKKPLRKEITNFNVDQNNPFKNDTENTNNGYFELDNVGEEVFNPNELFSNDGLQSETSVAKEIFNPKNPKIKSELSEREINILCRLYNKSKIYYEPRGLFMLKRTLDEFVLLRISKDRKSRSEFIQSLQETRKKENGGFFDRLMGRGNIGSGGI